MSLINYQLILIILTNVSANFCQDRVMTRFAIDATQTNGIAPNPSSVAAILCPEIEGQYFLIRYASKNGVLITLKNPHDKDMANSRDFDLHRNYNLLDVDCPGAFDALRKANATGMFIGPAKWLLLQDLRKEKSEENLLNLFKNLSVLPDSDVVIGQRVADDLVRLISMYKTNPTGKLIVEDRGHWKNGEGFFLKTTEVSSVRRKDLRGTPLTASIVLEHPDSLNHLTDFQDRHIDPIGKANYPWIIFLGEMMNATLSFVPVKTWGYRSSNGSWSGLTGLLARREVDLAGTASFLTPERMEVVEFVSLYTPTRARFIFRRPPLSYVSNIFVLPFHTKVWVASGILLIIIAGLLHVACYWEWYTTPKEERYKPNHSGNVSLVSWSDNFMIIIGAVSQQGSSFEPRGISPRIIFLMLLVTFLSLYTSYTANIVALLQSSTTSINSLESLLHSSMKIGAHDVVWNRHYFKVFQDPVRKAIYEQKLMSNGQKHAWLSMEDGVNRLRKGLFAFHAECGSAYKLIQETFQEDEKCGLTEIDFLHVLNPILPIQKQSPYLELMRTNALKLHEVGLQTRQLTRIYTEKPVCHGDTSFISVGLIDSYAAFTTLAWGMIISLAVLLLEIIWRRKALLMSKTDDSVSVQYTETELSRSIS